MAREPKLGVAVGRKGVGKTYQTELMIRKYIVGNPASGVRARRVLILDVNDEYEYIRPIAIKDVVRFSSHPIIEARRIRPFLENGVRMTLRDVQDALFRILTDFRNGMLLIEDPNKYLSDNLPNDLVGAICTNRHTDTDIILHFQSIGRISPKIWQNMNWLRFHKNTDSVDRHRDKFEDKYEMLKLVENYVNEQYRNGNERFFCYVDIDDEKIKGVNMAQFDQVIDKYLSDNYVKLISPMLKSRDLGRGDKKFTAATAAQFERDRIKKAYLIK